MKKYLKKDITTEAHKPKNDTKIMHSNGPMLDKTKPIPMIHDAEETSLNQRVELEALKPMIVNDIKEEMTLKNVDTVLKMLLEEKMRREGLKKEAERKKKEEEEEKA